jgi:hypothetical protein
MEKLIPRVVQVLPTDEHSIYAYFNDGSVHLYDAKPIISRGGAFKALEDSDVFVNTATVLNHTVAWDLSGRRDEYDCLDIDPWTVYNSPKVADPLET